MSVDSASHSGDRDELIAWLRLLLTAGVGGQTARALLKAFGSPEAVFKASADALAAAIGTGPHIEALKTRAGDLDRRADDTLNWCAEGGNRTRRWVALGDPLYPPALLNTADPPLLLFLQGRVDLLAARSLAIVGSRNATAQGMENARAFAAHLSAEGFTIVSGLALGIDAAAHAGGLEGRSSTIAVVGTGLDVVYPRGNLALTRRIADEGLIVSEFPLGTPPLAANFPRRNRIIAGLALGTLVVEAATRSGSLITARLAAEAGREVFAIPGSIHSPLSRGCHQLIKQGAKLVETADDIVQDLAPSLARTLRSPQPVALPSADLGLLDALGFDPTSLDALSARTGWPTHQLSARLLELELQGVVARLPGGLYQRVERA